MKEEIVEEINLSVQKICIILGVSESGYYKYCKEPEGKREKRDREITSSILKIFKESRKTAGTETIYNILKKEGKQAVSRVKIRKIKKENNIYPKTTKKFKATTNSNHNQLVAENILERNFRQKEYGTACVTDITYIGTEENWLYLAIVKELKSRKIIGFAMGDRITKELVIEATNMAYIHGKLKKNCIFHSDRGSQYCSIAYRKLLESKGFLCSMSRKGNCWDNAPAESFFATLKKDLVYHEHYKTRDDARASIFEYIVVFYNQIRRSSCIGYKTPDEYAAELLAN